MSLRTTQLCVVLVGSLMLLAACGRGDPPQEEGAQVGKPLATQGQAPLAEQAQASSQAPPARPQDLLVSATDLPGWGDGSPVTDETYQRLVSPIGQCLSGVRPSQVEAEGLSFSYNEDTVRSRVLKYGTAEEASNALKVRRTPQYRACVGQANPPSSSDHKVDVTPLPVECKNGVSAVRMTYSAPGPVSSVESVVYSITYLVTVTRGNYESVIEASHDPNYEGADERLITQLVERLQTRA